MRKRELKQVEEVVNVALATDNLSTLTNSYREIQSERDKNKSYANDALILYERIKGKENDETENMLLYFLKKLVVEQAEKQSSYSKLLSKVNNKLHARRADLEEQALTPAKRARRLLGQIVEDKTQTGEEAGELYNQIKFSMVKDVGAPEFVNKKFDDVIATYTEFELEQVVNSFLLNNTIPVAVAA